MANVEIYTGALCPYCSRAKALLKSRGVDFTEIDVTFSRGRKAEMMERAQGRHTVPQIFIDGVHIGGSDDLAALDAEGKLAPMLAGGSEAAE